MAYTLNQGIDTGSMDRVQRSLLVGLPAIALILSLGAILHRHSVNNPTAGGAKLIPIVSTLKYDGSSSGTSNPSANSAAPSAGASSLGTGSNSLASAGSSTRPSSSGSMAVIGGRGGSPIVGSTVAIPPLGLQAVSKQLVSSPGTTLSIDP